MAEANVIVHNADEKTLAHGRGEGVTPRLDVMTDAGQEERDVLAGLAVDELSEHLVDTLSITCEFAQERSADDELVLKAHCSVTSTAEIAHRIRDWIRARRSVLPTGGSASHDNHVRCARPTACLQAASPALLAACEQALTALNTAPRFRVPALDTGTEKMDSYMIASLLTRVIALAKEDSPAQ